MKAYITHLLLVGARAFKHRRLATFCLKTGALFKNALLLTVKISFFARHLFISLRNRLIRERKISPKANSLRTPTRRRWVRTLDTSARRSFFLTLLFFKTICSQELSFPRKRESGCSRGFFTGYQLKQTALHLP